MYRLMGLLGLLVTAQAAPNPHLPKPSFDTTAPVLPATIDRAVLIVSKTNGWRHFEHIPHSNAVLMKIAQELGRPAFATENGAVFNDDQLERFSVIVLNSASGEFLTAAQRAAFKRFIDRGGGVVALHAAGDDSHVSPWYVDTIIGTTFIGHPGAADHIQAAKLVVDHPEHPVMTGVALPWSPKDEWYSFSRDPATKGMTVLARLDETTYRPGSKLAMGSHPIIWTNPNTRGRVIYSALGHTPESYDDPNHRRILRNAIRWAAR
ncbi:ThuA domain-containing protein [Sphingomonas desiccabilis]|uniref:ThuA domain-containing protein n=1 Tax=Sphingomonas desiccabilis TaxID=429134 RepID=A0A4Q2IPA2_9SPHN|nr:ThuA domain-containing protein [Sphingomonas desiccabilis]MBB3912583.1 hypothetical protein [Sphingomonas desiccabilis]RXZ29876.1 ThuA domain-containing protein [Sphingomonas desiccabilis]